VARILVVDDEPLVRKSIKHILTSQGHEVLEAENGRSGEALALQEHPEVIVIDIVMPEQEGLATIISLHRKRPDIRVLAISGGGQRRYPEFLRIAKEFGADATLAKPFDRAALINALAPLLPGAPGPQRA
jgi:CheY-like chemotaxis protein